MSDFFSEAAKELQENSEESYPETWDPKEGDVLAGTFEKCRIVQTKAGEHRYVVHIKNHEDDTTYSVWLSPFMLKQEMLDSSPAEGSLIFVQYAGKKKTKDGQREYRVYGVRAEKQDLEYWDNLAKQMLAKETLGRVDSGGAVIVQQTPYGPDDAPF